MNTNPFSIGGSIRLVYLDEARMQLLHLKNLPFETLALRDLAWQRVSEVSDIGGFMADLLNADGHVEDERYISAETCSTLAEISVLHLVADGRVRLAEHRRLGAARGPVHAARP